MQFCDLITQIFLIYRRGKQVIQPQELSETKVKSQYKAADDTLHEQERDILKVWKKGENYKIIFGIENQTNTDTTMSFRVMGYDAAITQGETLKLIVLVQKKIKRGDSISKIADDLVEDEITITPIYKIVKEFPEDTERDIYWKLNDSMQG